MTGRGLIKPFQNKKGKKNLGYPKKSSLFTYIDDIFFIWRGSEAELVTFIEHLNKAHPSIKFTSTYNTETKTIPFLDMQITIDEEGIIQTDLYTKDTARAQYLLRQSCHPGHITQNIPYSMALRLL